MPPLRLFLTGNPGSGKTTVVRRVSDILREQNMRVGGVISSEIRRQGTRVGFSLEDLLTHETGILAHADQKDGPRVGKYRVNLADVERVGATAMQRAVAEADVVVVDELGPMELYSLPFIESVELALRSEKILVGIIHKRASHPLVTAVKSDPAHRIIEVTLGNRAQLPNEITRQIIGNA
jgi:nucleoside-triphosphatase